MQSKIKESPAMSLVAQYDATWYRAMAVVLSLFASTAAALPLEGRTVEISNPGYVAGFNVLVGPGAEVGFLGGLSSIDLYDVDANTGRVVMEVWIGSGFADAPNRVRFVDVNDSMPAILSVTLNGAGTSHPNAGADRINFGENFFEYEFGGLVGGPGSIMLDVAFAESSAKLADLSLASQIVAGCKSVSGKVTLSTPAPAAGAVVTISDTLVSATPPVSVTVPAGATTKTFSIKTTLVPAPGETGTVSATLGLTTLSQDLTVRPIGLASVSLTPTSAVGGNPVTGKATLECKAGPGPITVDLSSGSPAVASPVAASIVVPQGLQSAYFDVTTNAVQTKSYATIAGTANGITKSRKLTVNVAAAVRPSSLKFGNVVVGTTAGPIGATVTNQGAVPFAVDGISLTGTYSHWFAQSNDCGASLDPGASCTISVTFTPLSAASKSAKLSIATSATATPLSVSVSGTGVLPP